MRMYDIIKKKRGGEELTREEIRYFTEGYCKGEIPDYQAAALLMAVYFRGMNARETADLTFAVRDSGERLDFSSVRGVRVDKHSTGGVGDKTSLVVAPLVAACGVKVAKMSGRGLGHTGGTVDKLESIPNFRTDLSEAEFLDAVNRVGVCIVGQSKTLAPADKKLYALRDVTATVDSLPLIVSSIMGKKLAADDDCIVLDVKTGSGAFCKSAEESEKLARAMVEVGRAAGKKMLALVTDMDAPLGYAVGNALEVKEAVETLKGRGPQDLTELCLELSAEMLYLAERGAKRECRNEAERALKSGAALDKFSEMITAQGGNAACLNDFSLFPQAEYSAPFKASADGYIARTDAEGYGEASLLLGAGRSSLGDEIDRGAGLVLKKKTGDGVKVGETIAVMYGSDRSKFAAAEERLQRATQIGAEKPPRRPLVLGRIE